MRLLIADRIPAERGRERTLRLRGVARGVLTGEVPAHARICGAGVDAVRSGPSCRWVRRLRCLLPLGWDGLLIRTGGLVGSCLLSRLLRARLARGLLSFR